MYDATFKLSPHRSLTRERFLLCENAVIATAGARTYNAEEVTGVHPSADGKVILLRDKSVLFAPETLASFEGKPVTLEHPREKVVGLDNWRQEAVGNLMNVRQGEGEYENALIADVLIFDKDTIEKVLSGECEALSAGFSSDADDVGGGIGVEKTLIGNHVAIVPKGRDSACILCDSLPNIGKKKMDETKKEAPAEVLKEKTDAEAGTSPDLIAVIAQLTERVAALEAMLSKPESETAETVTDADTDAEKEKPADAETPAPAPESETVTEEAAKPETEKEDAPAETEAPAAKFPTAEEIAELIIQKLKTGNTSPAAEKVEKTDACIKNDAADVAPNVDSNTPNLALAALTEFYKKPEGKSFIDGMGGIKNDSAPALLKSCACFVRAKGKQAVQAVKNDSSPAKAPETFTARAKSLWK
jgi:hypothetical protein